MACISCYRASIDLVPPGLGFVNAADHMTTIDWAEIEQECGAYHTEDLDL